MICIIDDGYFNPLYYKGLKYPSSIINAIMQYTTVNPNIASLKWGRDHEETARRKYEELMREKHDGFQNYSLISLRMVQKKWPLLIFPVMKINGIVFVVRINLGE